MFARSFAASAILAWRSASSPSWSTARASLANKELVFPADRQTALEAVLPRAYAGWEEPPS